jgi:multidrug resistance efflux pump
MELILLILYSIVVWFIFFKKKWLPWNITSQVIVVTIPIFALTVIILFMNIVAPSSHDVRTMNYTIPVVPRVAGQVTEVPIEPNRPIKKGDVLFKIDPVPFEAALKASEATLQGAKDQLNNATAKKASLMPRIDLAKKRVEQFTQLTASGAGKRADLEQAQSDLGNLESEYLAADATESQSKAQISKSEADVINAKYDLDGCVYVAPANGRVANLALQPGVRATTVTANAVMSFIQEDNPWILAFYHAQGQMPISGTVGTTAGLGLLSDLIAVRLLVEPKEKDLFLATGAVGAGAIYTEHGKLLHIIRKVFVRVSTKIDWFVFKLH